MTAVLLILCLALLLAPLAFFVASVIAAPLLPDTDGIAQAVFASDDPEMKPKTLESLCLPPVGDDDTHHAAAA